MSDAVVLDIPIRVDEAFKVVRVFSSTEKVLLAKLLLDSVVSPEDEYEADWQQMSLASFEKDWDNPDDAIYDNWRELYGVQER